MNSKQLIAIVAVAIVIVAGTAVFLTAEPEHDDTVRDYGGSLMVYGNVNEDSVLDEKDIELLEKIISGESNKTKFSDANHDGVVDDKDIKHIQNLIDRKDGTTVWYIDGADLDAKATWPIDKINVLYRAQQTALAIGLDDTKVILFSEADKMLYERFAGAKWVNSKAKLSDFDSMTQNGVPDAIISVTTKGTQLDPTIKEIYDKAGIDIIRVPNMEGYGTAGTALTVGFLVGTIEQSQKYAAWNTSMLNDVKRIVESIPDNKRVTSQMWESGVFAPGFGNDYTNAMIFAGGVPICDWEGNKMLTMDNRAWFYNYDPDYLLSNITLGYSAPAEKGIQKYTSWAPVIEQMRAYQEGHWCIVDSSMPQSLRIAYWAEFMYPEFFGENYGDNWHKQLIDLYGIDYVVDGQFIVTPEDVANWGK